MLLYGIVIMIVILIIVFGFFSYSKTQGIAEKPPEQEEISPASSGFDYSKFILTPNDPNHLGGTMDQEIKKSLCEALKRCIIKGFFENKTCEVGEISFGDMNNPTQSFGTFENLFSGCSGPISYNLSGTVSQKICNLDPSNYGGDLYYSSDYDMQLSYWDCSVRENEVTYSHIRHLYSEAYAYTPSGSFHFTPGRIKIYLGRINRSYSDNCGFNLYYCYLPAIADSVNDPAIGVFEYFRTLEIYPIDDFRFIQGGYWYIIPGYSPNGGTIISRDVAFKNFGDYYGLHSDDYYENYFSSICNDYCLSSSSANCYDNCMTTFENEYSPECGKGRYSDRENHYFSAVCNNNNNCMITSRATYSSDRPVYCLPSERCIRYENPDEDKCYHEIAYNWSSVEIDLKNKKYNPVVIINAIKNGLYENTYEYNTYPMLSNERHIWEGSWDVSSGSLGSDCFPSVDMNSFTGRKIVYNCGGGSDPNKCDGNLTIKVSVKQVFDGPTVNLSTVVGVCDH